MRFWTDIHQVNSKSTGFESKIIKNDKSLTISKPKSLNRITNISWSQISVLCVF